MLSIYFSASEGPSEVIGRSHLQTGLPLCHVTAPCDLSCDQAV